MLCSIPRFKEQLFESRNGTPIQQLTVTQFKFIHMAPLRLLDLRSFVRSSLPREVDCNLCILTFALPECIDTGLTYKFNSISSSQHRAIGFPFHLVLGLKWFNIRRVVGLKSLIFKRLKDGVSCETDQLVVECTILTVFKSSRIFGA